MIKLLKVESAFQNPSTHDTIELINKIKEYVKIKWDKDYDNKITF